MSGPTLNRVVADFSAAITGDQSLRLKDLRGQNVVLYFYPKDSTPGCTIEGQDFASNHAKFKRLNTVILGVSRDTVASHEKFRAKYNFPFELLSDSEEKACSIFDVIKEKNMYGRKVMGIERSTFLVNTKGKLVREWRKIKVKGHVDDVLAAVRDL